MNRNQGDDTIVIKAGLAPRPRMGAYALNLITGSRTEQTAGVGAMEIVAPRSQVPQQATWSFFAVPQHDLAGERSDSHDDFEKWFTKLKSFNRMKDGWDSYTAPAPTREAIVATKLYLSTLKMLGWEPTRVEASVMGGVGITHRQGNRKVYIEFYNDGKVHALFTDRTPNMQTISVGADVQGYSRLIVKARKYLHG